MGPHLEGYSWRKPSKEKTMEKQKNKKKKEAEPTVVDATNQFKAKARIVLLGFKHPDLFARDHKTGLRKMSTAVPTLSRLGRNLLLQATALQGHLLESADAKSAFLQSEKKLTGEPLCTRGVPELSHALGISPGNAMQVIGAVYGLTIAPRLFWLDADEKLQLRGGLPHAAEKCLWIFKEQNTGKVIGRVGCHVDDFLICGDETDPAWLSTKEDINKMYAWSPWQKGQLTFAGCELQQLKDGTIVLGQQEFCNSLRLFFLPTPGRAL